jgi:hypothetical protein
MNRRTFVGHSLALIAVRNFPCCSEAHAMFTAQGCRLSAASAGHGRQTLKSSGDAVTDLLVRTLLDRQKFGVRPGIVYIDDGSSPNAFAQPDALSANGPDGTIMLGVKLLSMIRQTKLDDLSYVDENSTFVTFHEMAHILQFKRGMSPAGPWQMEPHADFLAGWAYANSLPKAALGMKESLERGVKLMFSLGDTEFNDAAHHGEPQFRAAMVRAGFDSAELGLDAAFERGMKYAGLS